MRKIIMGAAFAITASLSVFADDNPDLEIINKIRAEGFNNSHVMETLGHLTDVIGPRLTGTPAMLEANNWTKDQLTEWGLENAHLDGFEFGPGWTMNSIQVHMTEPRKSQLYAYPISWHPGTDGTLEGDVVYAPMRSKADFEKYKGTLKGKIVLVSRVRAQREPSNKIFTRRDAESLKKTSEYRVPATNPSKELSGWVNFFNFGYELEHFLREEGAAAMVKRSPRGAALIEASGYQHWDGETAQVPGISMAAEHYERMVRLINQDKPVKLAMNVDVTFHTDDMKSYSTLAEIKGKGRNPEVVMLGAHLDSWFVGDGAVDNGAGVAVTMEAMRILKAIGIKPKRTIRIGLWGGEEQGYFGSQQYVMDHLVTRPLNDDPRMKYMGPYEKHYGQFPMTKLRGYEKFSTYFNLDNGSGKIRGIYAEGNTAAADIFEKWLKPFHDVGAKTVTLNNTGGTDHEPFDDVGLPGFQFIQDPLDYGSRLHHSQIDMLDHAYAKDLKQAAVIMASFVYHAAMREERFPRKPEPTGDEE
jgi:hypothetical protein